MELREFVSASLLQIAQGINDANQALGELDASVNPTGVCPVKDGAEGVYGHVNNAGTIKRIAHSVDFDIAVHASDATETKGGIGIVVATFALGSQGKSDQEQSSQSRIKFSVPVVYPQGKHVRPKS